MISERVYTDKEGRMFVPMNVEGNTYHEHFITTPKLLTISGIVFWLVYIIASLSQNQFATWQTWLANIVLWLFVSQLALRYIVFEEKYYYKMYKEMKREKITTPAAFWYVANLKDTDNGCLITYLDGKIGYLIRLEKDTITGKPPQFMEEHYDGLSDFYKELNKRGYRYIQANIMEIAGKDERLKELDKLVYKQDNTNLQKLMQYQVGYIKNVTRRALYESDYFLIYTSNLNKIDSISNDIADCVYHLLDGAYTSYTVLDSEELGDMIKEDNGVKYFNPTDATLRMFHRQGAKLANPFIIREIEYSDGDSQEITPANMDKLRVIEMKLRNKEELKATIKETLEVKGSKKEISWLDAYDASGVNEEFIADGESASKTLLEEVNTIYEEFVEDEDFGTVESIEEAEVKTVDDEIIDF